MKHPSSAAMQSITPSMSLNSHPRGADLRAGGIRFDRFRVAFFQAEERRFHKSIRSCRENQCYGEIEREFSQESPTWRLGNQEDLLPEIERVRNLAHIAHRIVAHNSQVSG